ncbi:hypothetical protein U27_01402 [Candidatus Vecturithrix granuli]|uniref:Uncharacterized protein n=1 Tax=Vecturithrix granuli TaxID=1499967 RepID=A0A081CA96_VECG1|nr:hypothetical protein U27_01402 [Candidatus Vecturithrix granuli]
MNGQDEVKHDDGFKNISDFSVNSVNWIAQRTHRKTREYLEQQRIEEINGLVEKGVQKVHFCAKILNTTTHFLYSWRVSDNVYL